MTKKESREPGVLADEFTKCYNEIIRNSDREGWDIYETLAFFSGCLAHALLGAVRGRPANEKAVLELAEEYHQLTIRNIRKINSLSPKEEK